MDKNFEREVLDRLKTIEVKLDDYKTIKEKAERAEIVSKQNEKRIDTLDTRLKDIENNPKRRYEQVVSLLISLIVGAIVGIVLMKIGLK